MSLVKDTSIVHDLTRPSLSRPSVRLDVSAELDRQERERIRLLAEKEQKEKALQERLTKRAALICTVLRRFLAAHTAGRQVELAAARAAALKKGRRRKKKLAPGESPSKDTKKKPKLTPVQEAWSNVLADLDERINKSKRCNLEDIYRGVAQLSPGEQQALHAIIVSAHKKVFLALGNLNANLENIKQAVAAAAAAHTYPVDKAHTVATKLGLQGLFERGATARQLLDIGHPADAVLRAGYSKADLVASCTDLKALHDANVGVENVVAGNSPLQLDGPQGARQLRLAGYSARDMLLGGRSHPWELRHGGYEKQDLVDAGMRPASIAAAGFAPPRSQPVSLYASSVSVLCSYPSRDLPMSVEGTRGTPWKLLLVPPVHEAPAKASSKGNLRMSNHGGPTVSRTLKLRIKEP